MLIIDRTLESEIRAHAQAAYPYECCGFLIGTVNGDSRTVEALRLAVNHRSDSPENRYLISPEQFKEVEDEARSERRAIVGFFHSHPDAPSRPSAYDRDHAWPWYAYLIISVVRGNPDQLSSWQLAEDRSDFTQQEISITEAACEVRN